MMERLKNWLISFLNSTIDVPGLTEKQEKIVLEGLIEFLFSFDNVNSEKAMQEKGKEFKAWIVEFLNRHVDIPFLNEKTEKAVIEALITLLFNFYPPKKK